MKEQNNSDNTRGGVIGFAGRVFARIRDFFVTSWSYLKNSNATFNSLGDELIASAQKDLVNLKTTLDNLWVIKDEDKKTTALYLAAVLGKCGFTFIIIGVSVIASLVKLTAGSGCLFLAGRWLTLGSKVFNILRETFTQTLVLLQKGLKKFVTNALELCKTIAQKLRHYAGKFSEAIINALQKIAVYLSNAWKTILDFVAAATRGFVNVARWIGNKLLNAWRITLEFAATVCRELKRLATKIIKNFGNAMIHCFKAICHLGLGALKAGFIISKGIVLSIAALFIETGIASSLSGVAKTMFILDESLAAGIGAFMDGVYASGNSFIKASKDANSVPAAANMVASDETEASDDSTYFSRKFRSNMHYVNENVASGGNKLLRCYEEQRNRMVGTSGWSRAEHNEEAVGLSSSHRQVMEM